MELSHIFYKEVPVDEDNTFLLNLSENNKIDSVKVNKSKTYEISGLSINQSSGHGVLSPSIKGKKVLSDILRTYAAEKDKFNLDLRIYKKDWLDITVSFKKKNRRLDKWF